MDEYKDEEESQDKYKCLAEWVTGKTDEWRDHRVQNYDTKWREYYNTWRGIWTGDSKTRESERAKLISPATQQAIEAHISEVEEATFGRGIFFDVEEDSKEPQKGTEIEVMKNNLTQDFKRDKIRKAVGDTLLNGGIFGTGIGEIVVKEISYLEPATQAIPGSPVSAVGTMEKKRFSVCLKPIQPNNFLIDPTATNVEDALGVAIEDFISPHTILKGMKDGTYRDVDIGLDEDESTLSATFDESSSKSDKVKVLRYYGLVPAEYLDEAEDEEYVTLFNDDTDGTEQYKDLVEAIVVIVNDSVVIKAERNPYMMKDRPIVAYQDDIVPNSFWGRGVAEKGYNSQKGLDAELRSRMDNLALTSVPMMAMDASRLPRGAKFQVKPGATVLTNGNPSEILKPLTFGQLDQNSYQQAREFERMLLQATGTTDAGAVNSAVGGETNNGALSMALGLLIKRNKRTLVNFQDGFLLKFVEKAAWRYMQFDPERYPVRNFKFVPVASLGIMAREYEQQQFAFLLQTMGTESPYYPLILQSIVDNSSVHNREELQAKIKETSKPNPQQQQMQLQMQQLQMAKLQADLQEAQAKAAKAQAEAGLTNLEAQFYPQEVQAKIISATTNNLADDPTDKAFKQRLELTDRVLKEREIKSKEKMVDVQMEGSRAAIAAKANAEQNKQHLQELHDKLGHITTHMNTPKEVVFDPVTGKIAGVSSGGKVTHRVKRGANGKATHIEPVQTEGTA